MASLSGARRNALVALLLFASACQSPMQPPSAEPLVPVAELRTRMQRLCIGGLTSEVDLDEGDARLRAFQQLLAEELPKAGFSAVPHPQVEPVFARVNKQLGGFYDPYTGLVDEARRERIWNAAREAMVKELGCQGFLWSRLAIVKALWTQGDAVWDGARMPVVNGSFEPGWGAALSLWLTIEDMQGKEVYFRAGAVQPLIGLKDTGLFSPAEGLQVPKAEILASEQQNRSAIRRALAPMLPREQEPEPVASTPNPMPRPTTAGSTMRH